MGLPRLQILCYAKSTKLGLIKKTKSLNRERNDSVKYTCAFAWFPPRRVEKLWREAIVDIAPFRNCWKRYTDSKSRSRREVRYRKNNKQLSSWQRWQSTNIAANDAVEHTASVSADHTRSIHRINLTSAWSTSVSRCDDWHTTSPRPKYVVSSLRHGSTCVPSCQSRPEARLPGPTGAGPTLAAAPYRPAPHTAPTFSLSDWAKLLRKLSPYSECWLALDRRRFVSDNSQRCYKQTVTWLCAVSNDSSKCRYSVTSCMAK